jgi:hypothetical protein
MAIYRIDSKRDQLVGWHYLWCKAVEGFDSSKHCARCLVGKYSKQFGLKAPINQDVELAYDEGTVLYFCGVSTPYAWKNNAHLAGRVNKDAYCSIEMWTGDILHVLGMEQIKFNDSVANHRFPDLGKEFLTCRNFQFGAQLFPAALSAQAA